MDAQQQPGMTVGQLGHHIGLHVTVNVEGMTVGGVLCEAEQWVPGVIVGVGALGNSLSIKLDTPIGGGERRGLLQRESHGADGVSVDDPARVRPQELTDVHPAGVPEEILELVRAGKTKQAIMKYRALNGATLEEARAFIASRGPSSPGCSSRTPEGFARKPRDVLDDDN